MIHILVGISGSGKSTYAKELCDANTVIINRDKLREMLFGFTEATAFKYYQTHKDELQRKELLVSELQYNLIWENLKSYRNVIIDDTNLNEIFLKKLLGTFIYSDIKFHIINTPLEVCLERNAKRERRVDEAVIKGQYEKFKSLLQKKDVLLKNIVRDIQPIICDPLLPDAVIVDIDGTVAFHHKRTAMEFDLCDTDLPIMPTIKAVKAFYESGTKIVFCSGRPEAYRHKTLSWLSDAFGWKQDDIELYMRPDRNFDKDWKIKEPIWRMLATKYNIVGMFDDRLQVTRHAVKLGLFVFNVNQHLREF